MPKTTNEIIKIAFENGNLLEATKYVVSTEFEKNQNVLWFSQSEVDELRKELKEMENKIINDSDLNMAEIKGAFIAICELQTIIDKFSQSSPVTGSYTRNTGRDTICADKNDWFLNSKKVKK